MIGLSANQMVGFIAQQLMKPLNHNYLPNLAKNIWPALQDPFYDRGARYSVPYVVWMDGIGWRNDKIGKDIAGMKVPWDIFWEAKPWTGKVGLLDDERDALAMPMQRDAMHTGAVPDLNTDDAAIIAKAGNDLAQLTSICNIKVTITDYQTLPEAKTWLHHSWSGDLLSAALYYLPKGTKPDVLSFWGPDANGVVQNDTLWILRKSKKPVLAHAFLNFMLDKKNAYDNFVQFNGYSPPQNTIDGDSLIKQGLIPKSLARGHPAPRPVREQPGAARAQRRRHDALAGRLVQVQGRLSGESLDLAGARHPRRRVALGLLPRRDVRGAERRARQPEHAQPAHPVLEPARLERRLPARDAAQHLAQRAVPQGLPAHRRLRRRGDGPLAR